MEGRKESAPFLLVYFIDFAAEWQKSTMENQGFLPFSFFICNFYHTDTDNSETICGTVENQLIDLDPDSVYF